MSYPEEFEKWWAGISKSGSLTRKEVGYKCYCKVRKQVAKAEETMLINESLSEQCKAKDKWIKHLLGQLDEKGIEDTFDRGQVLY